jgi:DNA-binding PadR family transcriptional regulator
MPRATLRCCGVDCEVPSFLDLRGLLSFWLLWELRAAPRRGAELAERLAWRRGDAPSPGTLYPALAALEEAGLVHKRREGRDTVYTLAAQGRRELACAVTMLATIFGDVAGEVRPNVVLRRDR